jgi:hypothetical protein
MQGTYSVKMLEKNNVACESCNEKWSKSLRAPSCLFSKELSPQLF